MTGLENFAVKGSIDGSVKMIKEAVSLLVRKGYTLEEADNIVANNFLRLHNNPNIKITVEKLCKAI